MFIHIVLKQEFAIDLMHFVPHVQANKELLRSD